MFRPWNCHNKSLCRSLMDVHSGSRHFPKHYHQAIGNCQSAQLSADRYDIRISVCLAMSGFVIWIGLTDNCREFLLTALFNQSYSFKSSKKRKRDPEGIPLFLPRRGMSIPLVVYACGPADTEGEFTRKGTFYSLLTLGISFALTWDKLPPIWEDRWSNLQNRNDN